MTLETKNDEITELQNNLEDVLHKLNELQNIPNPAIEIIEDGVKDREKLQSNFDTREDAYCGLEIEIITLKSILKQIK